MITQALSALFGPRAPSRIRVVAPSVRAGVEDAARASSPAQADVELSDAALEQVVGGLARTWAADAAAAPDAS